MRVGRLARRRIDARHAGVGIDERLRPVGERDRLRFEAVGRVFEAAGGEQGVLGDEPRGVELPNGAGLEPHEALVLVAGHRRRRRDQLGVEDRADLPADVVEHAVGVDDAIALAEDDVAFHVDFERRVVLLRDLADVAARQRRAGPDDDPIGLDVDRAERPERRRQAFDAQALR